MSKAGKQRVPDYLGHILEAIRRIHLYIEDMTEVQFLEDAKTQDAVIRNFEIIGEACRNIDSHHPSSHRNILRCHEIVWKTVHNDLPNLADQINTLLGKSHEA
jgi:uncharacterized protein with HEPN domain